MLPGVFLPLCSGPLAQSISRQVDATDEVVARAYDAAGLPPAARAQAVAAVLTARYGNMHGLLGDRLSEDQSAWAGLRPSLRLLPCS